MSSSLSEQAIHRRLGEIAMQPVDKWLLRFSKAGKQQDMFAQKPHRGAWSVVDGSTEQL